MLDQMVLRSAFESALKMQRNPTMSYLVNRSNDLYPAHLQCQSDCFLEPKSYDYRRTNCFASNVAQPPSTARAEA